MQQRLCSLRQQYSWHWAPKQPEAVIVTALRQQHGWSLLKLSAQHLAALEQVLQQRLGRRTGDSTRLLAAVLQHKVQAARCSAPVMAERAQQLAEVRGEVVQLLLLLVLLPLLLGSGACVTCGQLVMAARQHAIPCPLLDVLPSAPLLLRLQTFGRDTVLAAPRSIAAQLLATKAAQWQQSLAVWRLLGVTDPAAVAAQHLGAVTYGWLEPQRLVRLLALQRLLPWQPTADEVLRRYATYVGGVSADKLISRLLFIWRAGKLPLLVADKRGEQLRWRRQQGVQGNRRAAGEPAYISMGDVAVLTDAQFAALLAPPGCEADTAARYASFAQSIEQQPEWQQLMAEAAGLQQRLAARLAQSPVEGS